MPGWRLLVVVLGMRKTNERSKEDPQCCMRKILNTTGTHITLDYILQQNTTLIYIYLHQSTQPLQQLSWENKHIYYINYINVIIPWQGYCPSNVRRLTGYRFPLSFNLYYKAIIS